MLGLSDLLILPIVLLFALIPIEEHDPGEEPVQQEEVDETGHKDSL